MTINGNGLVPGAGGADAVLFWNDSNGTVSDSAVNGGLTEATISGNQTGQGVAVDGMSNLTLSNVAISGFQKNGVDIINGNGATSGGGAVTVTVNGGSITGVGATDKIAQNGVVVWDRGGNTVSAYVNGTAISDLDYTPASDYAAGILLYAGGSLDPASNATYSNVEYSLVQSANSPTDETIAGSDGATVTIPANTVVTASGDWNGTISAPTATTVTVPAAPGYAATVGLAVSVGSSTANLTFDNPVRLVLPGQAGKLAGFIPVGGFFTPITTSCGSDPVTTPPAVMATANECVVNNGSDLVIWTNHFTTYVAYTVAPVSNGGQGQGQGGNSSAAGSTPTTNTVTSSSAPVATTAVATTTSSEDSDTANGAEAGSVAGKLGDALKGSDKKAAVAKTEDTNLAWYWWVLIAAAIAALLGSGYYYRSRAQQTSGKK
jgi:hypothetical protein